MSYVTLITGILPALLTIVTWLLFLKAKKIFSQAGHRPVSLPLREVRPDNVQMDNPEEIKEKLENSKEGEIKKGLCNVQHLPREERREHNKMFMRCLLESNKNCKQESIIWMKQNIDPASCKRIFPDFNYDHKWLERLEDWIEDVLLKLKSYFESIKTKCGIEGGDRSNMWAIFKRFVLVSVSYMDLIKDCTLLAILVYLLQGALLTHFTTFACQVTWHLGASIVIPLVISALQTAHHRPLLILGFLSWEHYQHSRPSRRRLWSFMVFTVFFYPLIPAILLHAREEAKQRMEDLLKHEQMTEGEMDEFEQVSKYLNEVRKAVLTFKRNEFGMEMVLQLTIQTVMVLLTKTISPTHTGLEAVFKEDFESQNTWLGTDLTVVFLSVSIMWSFVTSARTYIKIKTEDKKGFLSITGKLLLGLRALLTTITRVACIVIFFCPFLGLWDIMVHWTAEQVSLDLSFSNDPYRHETDPPINIQTSHYTYNNRDSKKTETVPFSTLYRSDYTDPTNPVPPGYQEYTVVTLGVSQQTKSIIFIIIEGSNKLRYIRWIVDFGCKFLPCHLLQLQLHSYTLF